MSLPLDIAWKKLAFSPDMFFNFSAITGFGQFPPAPLWRPSMTAFYHIVPEEETKDLYLDCRIVYLKISVSITGINFWEEAVSSGGGAPYPFTWDFDNLLLPLPDFTNFETSVLQMMSGGPLPEYYPCSGAILQAIVGPHPSDSIVDVAQFPYIVDFEPKKREIYETLSNSGEVLSGSSSSLNIKKGVTSTESLEENDLNTGRSEKVSSSFWGIGASADFSYTGKWGTVKHTGQDVNTVESADSSRERREKFSYTTTLSQMYQTLLSYHLGTNRALWAISPRPHIVDTDFSLIKVSKQTTAGGAVIGRQLEGIQDIFLTVCLDKRSTGFCFSALLDTGYDLPASAFFWDGSPFKSSLVVMRRLIAGCGKFNVNGGLDLEPAPHEEQTDDSRANYYEILENPTVVFEVEHPFPDPVIKPEDLRDASRKRELVFEANTKAKYILHKILEGQSSRRYRPRPFAETTIFRNIVDAGLRASDYKLAELDFLSPQQLSQLKRLNCTTVGELFSNLELKSNLVESTRARIVDAARQVGPKLVARRREYYRTRTASRRDS
jgi:hypothetical protein